jgi:hypothetical protein
MKTQTDFYYQNGGTIILLIPNTNDAEEWINENLYLESWQRLGKNVPIEWRYFDAIAEGAERDGLIDKYGALWAAILVGTIIGLLKYNLKNKES